MHKIRYSLLLVATVLLGSFAQHAKPMVVSTGQAPATEGEPDTALSSFQKRISAAAKVAFELEHTPAEWTAAEVSLRSALADPLFKQLGAPDQARVHSGAGWAAIRLGNYVRARDQLLRATQLNPEASDDWLWLARLDDELGDYDSAAMAMVGYLRKWQLEDDQTVFVIQLVRKADPSSVSRLVLLQALFDSNWQPKPLGASELWYELALSHLRNNQPEKARAAIARFNSPDMLVRLRSDKRFDTLVDLKSPALDVEAAARQQVKELREQSPQPAAITRASVDLARALLVLGEHQAVLDFVGPLLALPVNSGAPLAEQEQRAWIANNRATALSRMGRRAEALDQLEAAARMTIFGRTNINQTLNLSLHYCGLDRGQDARATAARITENLNGYGKTVQKLAEHCAAVLLGDEGGAADAFSYLAANQKDGPFPYLLALLRSKRMDEAARAVIARLVSEQDRGQMLYDLQDFREAKPLPANIELEARWQALTKRKDVVQALEKVGRKQRYEIFGN